MLGEVRLAPGQSNGVTVDGREFSLYIPMLTLAF